MAARKDPLIRLAGQISDRSEAVDWRRERARSPTLGPSLDRLQRVASVASAFEDLHHDSQPRNDSADSPLCLFRWGHLEVRDRLGEGSFGEVHRAFDPILEREVALKLRAPGAGEGRTSDRRYVEEARRLARVRHPNVLAIHGADLHDGRVGLWTELVSGKTLDERLTGGELLGAREALLIGIELCHALAAVHRAGLLHGDVKAANVIREEGGRIVLGDFGSGSELIAGEAASRTVSGSPLSLAPEVLRGEAASPASDLYSLGVLLYRLVSDRYPVSGKDLPDLLDRHRRGEREALRDRRPDLPAAYIAAVEKALAPEPQERYRSAGAMERGLSEALRDVAARNVTQSKRTHSRWRWAAPVAAGLFAAALIVPALWLVDHGEGRPPGTGEVVERSPEAPDRAAPSGGETLALVRPPGPSPTSGIRAEVGLYRDRRGARERLEDRSAVRPGDKLFMEVEVAEKSHLYVLNGDRKGALFVLFPLTGVALTNPVEPHRRHRLPAADEDWQVTTAGGTETFLVVASRTRLSDLEEELSRLREADRNASLELRGIGGRAPAEAKPPTRLGEILRGLEARRQASGDIWLQSFELANPE